MSKILVFIEGHNKKIKKASLELLSFAKNSGQSVVAVAFGSQAKDLADEAGKMGATELHTIAQTQFDNYNPQLFLENIAPIIQKTNPQIILASASGLAKDLFPRVAARLNTGIISDAIELKITGDNLTCKKPFYSGKCTAQVEFANSPHKIVLVRPNQLTINAPGAGSAQLTEHVPVSKDLATILKEVVKGTSEKLDLTEANIIVSGGRGLKEAGNFKLLNDLADVLSATVGASRAVVDAGWVGHDMQVGQTGKTVAPTLYIAVGISGAIQHLAGMSSSKVIVAINNDPNAPIFQKATYGIVGDLFDVIPKLTEEFKKVLH